MQTSYDKTLEKLTFINEELTPESDWQKSEVLISKIDIDDIDFVALIKFLKGSLWTGDKRLYEGLKAKDLELFIILKT